MSEEQIEGISNLCPNCGGQIVMPLETAREALMIADAGNMYVHHQKRLLAKPMLETEVEVVANTAKSFLMLKRDLNE